MKFSLALVAALLVVVPAMGVQIRRVHMPVNPNIEHEDRPEIGTQIVNGKVAKAGELPYQVGITMDDSYFCGGSVISESWVLTAGHCVDGIQSFSIVFGTLKPFGDSSAVKRTSSNGFLHPEYVQNDYVIANDIAVVGLSNPITYTKLIKPITLATDDSEKYVGKSVTVSGWGLTSDEATSISQRLNYVKLRIIDNSRGVEEYGEESVNDKTLVTDGSQRKSDCEGDSGGPLTITSGFFRRTTKQIGIVSFGSIHGCSKGYPSVYTKVASHIKWLENTTGLKF